MTDDKKLEYGIIGIIASLIVASLGFRLIFREGLFVLGLIFLIGASIGAIISIVELIRAKKTN